MSKKSDEIIKEIDKITEKHKGNPETPEYDEIIKALEELTEIVFS